jgi:hypothetical protein
MRTFTPRVAATAVVAIGSLLVFPSIASAHGDTAQGDLQMAIGFAEEPAYAGQPNAAEITLIHDGKPVTDLKPGDLTVDISFGDTSTGPVDLEPWFFFEDGRLEFGTPGQYRAPFVPSEPGPYTFTFAGSVDGENIDETMTSGPETFSEVESLSEAAFPPVEAPTNQELADRLERDATRADEAIAAAEDSAAAAEDAASSARTMGLIGVLLGAIGVIAAIAALVTARRRD